MESCILSHGGRAKHICQDMTLGPSCWGWTRYTPQEPPHLEPSDLADPRHQGLSCTPHSRTCMTPLSEVFSPMSLPSWDTHCQIDMQRKVGDTEFTLH